MNEEITIACILKHVQKYKVAERLGITDTSFSRKLRKELPRDEKIKILNIINELAS